MLLAEGMIGCDAADLVLFPLSFYATVLAPIDFQTQGAVVAGPCTEGTTPWSDPKVCQLAADLAIVP